MLVSSLLAKALKNANLVLRVGYVLSPKPCYKMKSCPVRYIRRMIVRSIFVPPSEQLAEIKMGCDLLVSEEELLKKLEDSYNLQKPLIVKFGADPSRPDIHLGHTVVINKLRLLQKFGHTIRFIIGDFTARIGDPTGRSKTRPQLSLEEVNQNAETYKDQIFKILDPLRTDIVYNGDWLEKLTPMDFIHLMATRTVQQQLAREDFQKRYEEQAPIFLHEFIYPILQAYDSVVLKADIELGGTDQTFNLLLGRELQKQRGQRPQSLIIMPLLEGLDGVQKMSKSYDNYISLTDSPKDMFGKTMSISDTHMLRFYELLSEKRAQEITAMKKAMEDGSAHPMELKKALAEEIVARYWGINVGKKAREEFEALFSKREIPQDLVEFKVSASEEGHLNIVDTAIKVGFASSKSEARRILQQNGMKINGDQISNERIEIKKGESYIFKYGKLKMIKLVIE